MKPLIVNAESQAKQNNNFRKVLYTGKHLQFVLMSLAPGEDIGMEIHAATDQFFCFEAGQGKSVIDGCEYPVAAGDAVLVPAGIEHNIINTGTGPLKMYTLYAPPNHQEGTIRATKEDAANLKETFDGKTSKQQV